MLFLKTMDKNQNITNKINDTFVNILIKIDYKKIKYTVSMLAR